MRSPRRILLCATMCAVALSGCRSVTTVGSNSQTTAGPAPTVIATGMQVNGVAPNRWQYVQFSQPMDPSTINGQTFLIANASGTNVPGNVMYDATLNVAGFQPNPALQENANYTATITTGVANSQGVHLDKPYTYSFTTRADTDKSPIYVKSVTPTPNATCVSTTTPITITFSEGADVSTLTATNLAITGPDNAAIPAQIGYDVALSQVTLTPKAPLSSGTITVTVKNVADAAGVAMTTTYGWSFSTACGAGGTGGGASMQYMAPLYGQGVSVGQVSVDTAGNVAVQLKGATASQAFTVQFCPLVPLQQSTSNCFALGAVSTDASGDGGLAVKFPKPGPWAASSS